jgi:hypothetical protein
MPHYNVRLGSFVITTVCEKCGTSYAYMNDLSQSTTSQFIPQPSQAQLQPIVAALAARRDAALRGESVKDLAFKKCPNCNYMQSWMRQNRVQDTSNGISVAAIILFCALYLYYYFAILVNSPLYQKVDQTVLSALACIIPLLTIIIAGMLFEKKVLRKIVWKMYQSKDASDASLPSNKPQVEFDESRGGVFGG